MRLPEGGVQRGRLCDPQPGSREPASGAEGPGRTSVAVTRRRRKGEGQRHHAEGEEEEGGGAEEEEQPFLAAAGFGPQLPGLQDVKNKRNIKKSCRETPKKT